MNINSMICQIDQMAGLLHHHGMEAYTEGDLRSLAGSLDSTINVVYAEIRRRMDAEQERAAEPRFAGGLLDGIGRPNNDGDAA